MKNKTYSIAVLLPTRGRTDSLGRSVYSLIDKADDVSKLHFLFGFDNDDDIGLNFFIDELQPDLDNREIHYTALTFDSIGYEGLNRYYNALADVADADWLFVWNDDCIMNTDLWDKEILKCTGEFNVLKVHTHNEHPYSIFPIVPASWYETLGHLSRHQMIDAEMSQIGYMLDIIKIIDIDVTHDRTDLTGNQSNEPPKPRIRYEGNTNNPLDFHNVAFVQKRMEDSEQLASLLKSMNASTTFWENVKALKQDPWEKLKKNDVNQQQFQFDMEG
jgi:hypothetical protein